MTKEPSPSVAIRFGRVTEELQQLEASHGRVSLLPYIAELQKQARGQIEILELVIYPDRTEANLANDEISNVLQDPKAAKIAEESVRQLEGTICQIRDRLELEEDSCVDSMSFIAEGSPNDEQIIEESERGRYFDETQFDDNPAVDLDIPDEGFGNCRPSDTLNMETRMFLITDED